MINSPKINISSRSTSPKLMSPPRANSPLGKTISEVSYKSTVKLHRAVNRVKSTFTSKPKSPAKEKVDAMEASDSSPVDYDRDQDLFDLPDFVESEGN